MNEAVREVRREEAQRVFTVFRVNPENMTREPIGRIVERRKAERLCNRIGLLQLARKKFPFDMDEICIGLREDWSGETQGLI